MVKHMIQISKKEFKEKRASEEYLQQKTTTDSADVTEHKETSVKQKIIEIFKSDAENIFSHSITPPMEYTITDLLDSARMLCEDVIKEYETSLAKLESLLNTLTVYNCRLAETDLDEKAAKLQKEKEKQAFYETLPREEQVVYNTFIKLKEIKKQMETEEFKQKRQEHNNKMKELYGDKKKGKIVTEEPTKNETS